MKKCVITYLYGNKEIIREPLVKDDDIEYICVTDDNNIKFGDWKPIYDPMKNIHSLRDKVANVKFNPFKYTDADEILIMDGSYQIKSYLNPLFEEFKDFDIGLKLHTYHFNLREELPYWLNRGLSKTQYINFHKMAEIDKIDLSKVTEYEGSLLLYKNNNYGKSFGDEVLSYMKMLGEGENLIVTNQCPLSYIVYKNHQKDKIYNINQFNYFNRFIHRSNMRWEH